MNQVHIVYEINGRAHMWSSPSKGWPIIRMTAMLLFIDEFLERQLRTEGKTFRRLYSVLPLVLAAVLVVGCDSAKSITGPTSTAPAHEARTLASFYAEGCAGQCRVDAALALIDFVQFGESLPWLRSGQTAGSWYRGQRLSINIVPDMPGIAANCCANDTINIDITGLGPMNGEVGLVATAGTLMHEARHRDIPHTCADQFRDRNEAEAGAWAVQAWFMEFIATRATNLTVSPATSGEILSFVGTLRAFQFCGE